MFLLKKKKEENESKNLRSERWKRIKYYEIFLIFFSEWRLFSGYEFLLFSYGYLALYFRLSL